MTSEELKTILENHKHWLNEDCSGWENMRADFQNADFQNADLRNADLRNADFQNANLQNTNLRNAEIDQNSEIFFPIACPDTDSFTAWKTAQGKIIKLEIPADAKRFSATTRKCRCDKAKVLAIQDVDGADLGLTDIRSNYDENFVYKIGETVAVDNFDDNRWNECSAGIHFFITREEAVNYI